MKTHSTVQRISYEAFYDFQSRLFVPVNDFLSLITIISILGIILETVPFLDPYTNFFQAVEYITVFFFSFEYIGRVVATKKPLRYIVSFFGIVDFLAILPTYLGLSNLTYLKSARMFRILRFLRVLRLVKLTRVIKKGSHHEDIEHYSSIHSMTIKIYLFAMLTTVVVLGTLIYVFESDQLAFSSIPSGMLWTLQAILGDSTATPKSLPGQMINLVARFVGLVMLGFLIHIVGTTVNRFLLGSRRISREKDIAS
ncbi:MAG: ion transporter [Patescibacteria group bacterium]